MINKDVKVNIEELIDFVSDELAEYLDDDINKDEELREDMVDFIYSLYNWLKEQPDPGLTVH